MPVVISGLFGPGAGRAPSSLKWSDTLLLSMMVGDMCPSISPKIWLDTAWVNLRPPGLTGVISPRGEQGENYHER